MTATRRRIASLLALAAILCAATFAGTPAHAASCAGQGCWSQPFSPGGLFDAAPPDTPQESMMFPAAATSVVLPSGAIEYWNGLQNLEDAQGPLAADAGEQAGASRTAVLDLSGNSPNFLVDSAPPPGDDLFCTDQRLTAKGDLVAVGGTHWESEFHTGVRPLGLAELYGSKHQHILRNGQWSLGDPMNKARWYPTMITMPDGRQLVAGGVSKLLWNSKVLEDIDQDDTDAAEQNAPYNVNQTEVREKNGSFTLNPSSADVTLPLYARLHLMPNGQLFFGGAGQMWGPAGEAMDQMEWNFQKVTDTSNLAAGWKTVGLPAYGARSGAFSVLLPLRPNANGEYDKAEVLIGGGVLGTSPGGYVATNLAEKVTAAKGDAGWSYSTKAVDDLVNRRWFSSAVTPPNGDVVALNGADVDEVIMPGTEGAVRQAEIFDGNEWKPLASGGRDRTYHNSAILLADGSILVGGHAPINQFYGDKGAAASPRGTNNLKDPSFERFFPPYLYRGNRPAIDTAQSHATWGGNLVVTLDPNNNTPVGKIVLSRLPSATHSTDADLRTVELPGFTRNGSELTASIPNDRNVLPPGYYYVFAMSPSGAPSVATILQIADPVNFDNRGNAATPVDVSASVPLSAASTPVTAVDPSREIASHEARTTITGGTAAVEPRRVPLPVSERRSGAVTVFAAVMLAVAGVMHRRRAHARA